jgi:DNA polymerase I-like protein with 3'-5' exonuclease and polymerase domains
MRIAVIDSCPNSNKYEKYFEFDFEVFHMSSIKLKKLLKKDIDLVINLEEFDYVITIGSEASKVYAGVTSVTDKAGHLVKEKFIPMMNPAMLLFKPEVKPAFEKAVENLELILQGKNRVNTDGDFRGIRDSKEAEDYLEEILRGPSKVVALDTETTALYPRDGYVLGISISAALRCGAYIEAEAMSDRAVELLQDIIDNKEIVFHNAKFDMKMLSYHFSLKFIEPATHDTLIQHYILDETQGTHGLKSLALKYTTYGDYDKDLDDFKTSYCKQYGVKKDDFTYDLIPFDVICKYAAIDTACTLELYQMFMPIISKNEKLIGLYRNIMMPSLFALTDIEDVGIPLDINHLQFAENMLGAKIFEAKKILYSMQEVKDYEQAKGSIFNPNSVVQLRTLLFDYLNLTPTGRVTGTGAHSTDAEVLEALKDEHPVVSQILVIRKLGKIKNTYVDKLIPQIDKDGRIRTGFNMTSTTSGRLSSSGKFNAQQIVRDDPIVKGCIKAKPGYKIVSQDLKTGEVYYAAVLSQDKNLMDVFRKGGNADFHSTIAHTVFNLSCIAEEVKKLFPDERQAAKAINMMVAFKSL